jgi:thiol-disulfide isomerase/thioredoxin
MESERKSYWYKIQGMYSSYKKQLRINTVENEKIQIALSIQNADIMFDDYMQYVNNKSLYAQSDKKNIELLAFTSPFSNVTKLSSVINLYESFADKYKKSQVGNKVFNILNSLKFEKNIGSSIKAFPEIIILDDSGNKLTTSNLQNNFKQYTIISFGASWCLPCRLSDLQLKQWYSQIDSSKIRVYTLSVDKYFSKWKQYLMEDSPLWSVYLVENEMNNAWVKKLQVEAIPLYFLFDKNGVVLAENTDIRKILKKIPILNTSNRYIR